MGYIVEINTDCPLCRSNIKCSKSLYKQSELYNTSNLVYNTGSLVKAVPSAKYYQPTYENGVSRTKATYETSFEIECPYCGLVFVVPFKLSQATSTLQVTYIKDDNGDDQPIIDRDDIPRQLIDEYHWSELNRLESEEEIRNG